jgi:lambda family phage minor tail protein L
MTDNVAIQLAQLRHDAIIELFVLDATAIGGAVYRFHAGTNELRQPVVWQGQTYEPMPIEASGFSRSTQGAMPRPTLRVSNVMGLIGLLVISNGGLKRATVIRRRVLRKYLDAANFVEGNASADATAGFADERWLIDRTAGRDKYRVEFELGSPMDVQNVQLPRRQVLAGTCTWKYRGGECGYTGPAVAKADDTPTTDLAEDDCGRRLSSCRLRVWPGNELPFGGFPGAGALGS